MAGREARPVISTGQAETAEKNLLMELYREIFPYNSIFFTLCFGDSVVNFLFFSVKISFLADIPCSWAMGYCFEVL